MKVLLFFGGEYSISRAFKNAFIELAHEVKIINYIDFLSMWKHKLDLRAGQLPKIYRDKIRKYYLKNIQSSYIKIVNEEKPDLILVYNDQMLEDETINVIKKTGCKIALFLADSPFFLVRREHIIKMMIQVDHIFAPDTYWIQQLETIGLTNISFLLPGYDNESFFPVEPSEEAEKKYRNDLFFLGAPYNNIWGFKRAMFLNTFTDFNFRFYGPLKWQNWFQDFPKLKNHFVPLYSSITDSEVNLIANCCKIYPVDANPGLINGIHIRVLECIGMGILPVVEYRKDIVDIFSEIDIPIFNNYHGAKEIINYYLQNANYRIKTIKALKAFIDKNYSTRIAVESIIRSVFE